MLDNVTNQLSKFRTENWIEINDQSGEVHNTGSNTKDVEIIFQLEYLSIFWKNLEMPLINREINLILTWSLLMFL